MKSGTNAPKFYVTYAAESPEDFLAHLLADLGSTIELNRRGLDWRNAILSGTFSCLAVAAIWFGLIRWLG